MKFPLPLFYNPVGFLTLLKREMHRFMKLPIQTLVAPLLSNLLYLAIFGGMLKTREGGLPGFNYLQFLVPGLAVMGALFAAFQNPAFSVISQKFQNTIQDLNSYPLTALEKALAFVLGGTVRGTLIGLLSCLAALFFVGFRVHNLPLFVLMLGATSFIFSSLGLITGLVFDSFERINFILSIILTPLAYLGGVFFEFSRLPGFPAFLKYLNPIFPLVDLTRYAFLGAGEGNRLISGLQILLLGLTLFGIAVAAFRRGLGVTVR